MRFRVYLERCGKEKHLSYCYPYQLSSAIYRILNSGDSDFASWLHEEGYRFENKRFKNFCFSRLFIADRESTKTSLVVNSEKVSFQLSFFLPDAAQPFVQGLFNQSEISLANQKYKMRFRVKSIERMKEPEWKEEMEFKSVSPIFQKWFNPRNENIQHLHPDHKEYERIFFQNLQHKYKAYSGKDCETSNCQLDILTEPKPKVLTVKESNREKTNLKSYDFMFRVKAPVELMQTLYHSGAGSANSQGFGCVEEIRKN